MLIGQNSFKIKFLSPSFTSKSYKLRKISFHGNHNTSTCSSGINGTTVHILGVWPQIFTPPPKSTLISEFPLNQTINISSTRKLCLLIYNLLPGKKAEGLSSHLITISMTHATREKHWFIWLIMVDKLQITEKLTNAWHLLNIHYSDTAFRISKPGSMLNQHSYSPVSCRHHIAPRLHTDENCILAISKMFWDSTQGPFPLWFLLCSFLLNTSKTKASASFSL